MAFELKLVVIGGGYAPTIYKLYFGNPHMGNPPVGTSDLDTLIPKTLPQASKKNIAKYLKDVGFKHVFKDNVKGAGVVAQHLSYIKLS